MVVLFYAEEKIGGGGGIDPQHYFELCCLENNSICCKDWNVCELSMSPYAGTPVAFSQSNAVNMAHGRGSRGSQSRFDPYACQLYMVLWKRSSIIEIYTQNYIVRNLYWDAKT